jgi:hypothetical protein
VSTRQPSFPELQRHSPTRALDWRWGRARQLLADGRRPSPLRDDAGTVAAVRFLRAEAGCGSDGDRARLDNQWLALRAARQLAAGDAPRRWEVQARILAGQGDEEIAQSCGLTAEAVRWFEALFFQVRDRLTRGRDWIMFRAVGGGPWNCFAGEQPGTVWRYAGYRGGPRLLELFIAVTMDKPLPDWVRASFTGNPAYQEAELRLRCQLTMALMTARSSEEIRDVLDIRARADRLHRRATGQGRPPDPVLGAMEGFFKKLGRRSQPPTATRATTAPGSNARARDAVGAAPPRQRQFSSSPQGGGD